MADVGAKSGSVMITSELLQRDMEKTQAHVASGGKMITSRRKYWDDDYCLTGEDTCPALI